MAMFVLIMIVKISAIRLNIIAGYKIKELLEIDNISFEIKLLREPGQKNLIKN